VIPRPEVQEGSRFESHLLPRIVELGSQGDPGHESRAGFQIGSLSDPKTADHFEILLAVVKSKILEQARAFRDHHQQPTATCVVFRVRLEVVRQIIDPCCQKRDLHFGRSRIVLAPAE